MGIGRRTRRVAPVLALATVTAALLAGCTSSPVAPAKAAASSAPVPTSPAPVATPTTPPPTQTAADATPVQKKCSKLVPKSVSQGLLPDLKVIKDWVPDAGTPTARLAALNGTACRWTDAAGDVLEVAAAKPSNDDATALKNDLVERSQSVPTFGGEAYFQVVDHIGQADVFRGRTWLQVRSNLFYEPGDATPVVQSALKELGFAPKATPTPTATPGQTPPTTPPPTATTN